MKSSVEIKDGSGFSLKVFHQDVGDYAVVETYPGNCQVIFDRFKYPNICAALKALMVAIEKDKKV